MPLYEVIVVGLGAVGSAATWHLARLGTQVLGIDRYKPPHEFGSSTGETRLTRAGEQSRQSRDRSLSADAGDKSVDDYAVNAVRKR
jgi:glycine/D-amino acid oxidase-like deaminating enzyme